MAQESVSKAEDAVSLTNYVFREVKYSKQSETKDNLIKFLEYIDFQEFLAMNHAKCVKLISGSISVFGFCLPTPLVLAIQGPLDPNNANFRAALGETGIRLLFGVLAVITSESIGTRICNKFLTPEDVITVFEPISKDDLSKSGYYPAGQKSSGSKEEPLKLEYYSLTSPGFQDTTKEHNPLHQNPHNTDHDGL